MTGEQKNFQRLAHGTGKKLAMEKEADQMRRIAHDTGKKKRPARTAWPERRGFSKFLRHASGRGSAEVRQIIPADAFGSRGNSAQAGNRQAASSGRKVHPAGKPPGQARRRKIPIGGLCPPFSLQQVSPPGPAPARQKANAPRPAHQQKHSGRAQIHGEQIPPFPTEKHVPPGSECCACALLPRENAFSDSPQGRLRHFLPA